MKQILNGFKSLRKQNIIHRDIKLKNILVKNNVLKIADFGLAINKDYASSQVGTPYTKAPEVYEGVNKYSDKADIWSLGIIFYQMLFDLNYPFPAKDERELQNKIKQGMISYNIQDIRISQQTQSLLNHMLQLNPDKRISWEELFNHPIFTQTENTSQRKLKRNASVNCFETMQGFSSASSDQNLIGMYGAKSISNIETVPVLMKEDESHDSQRFPVQKQNNQKSNTNSHSHSTNYINGYSSMKQQYLSKQKSNDEEEKSPNYINGNSTYKESKSHIDSQMSTQSSAEQQTQKYRNIMNLLQETLINTFVINNIDKSISDNQELQKFCCGTQFELSLFLKYIDEKVIPEDEICQFHKELQDEACLNIVQYLSEPRKLQEIDSYDRTKFLKCLRKYFNCLLAQSKFIYENTTNSSRAVKILDHAYDILKCAQESSQFNNSNNNFNPTSTISPKQQENLEKIFSNKYSTFYLNLNEFARNVF